ncbi:MAG: corrinoid protein [SAR324 cluster bacterium]|nr:corrinoid protein [SAR324 cluster bacterium]
MAKNQELVDAIINGDRKTSAKLVQDSVDDGVEVVELLNESMIPAMKEIGEKFARNEVYVPEMLIAARAMQAGLNIIEPILSAKGHQPVGKVCIGTVKGDLHDIGKNLVVMMLKGAGWEVNDLGVDCDINKFQAAVDEGAQAVCCSALLTTTMDYMRAISEHFSNTETKMFIGGAPITQDFADEIRADGYAENANDAVRLISEVLGTNA